MTKKVDLTKAQILVADGDRMMAEVLRKTLYQMGLENVHVVYSGRAAIETLRTKEVDILITEWQMSPMDGMTLVNTLRQSEEAKFALLPVVMLTARAEKTDVIEARDKGVTEFLVKPFTAKTLFNRLEHVIDFPRDFIVTDVYVGPDRRRVRKSLKQSKLAEDRRVVEPMAQSESYKMPHASRSQPRRIISGHAIKKKMGLVSGLNQVITDEILQSAQDAIASFEDESLKWIAEDLAVLEANIGKLKQGDVAETGEVVKHALLSLKARAGTFDYMLASEVAFAFYGFLRNHFDTDNKNHLTILQKHYDVLKIILSRKVKGNGTERERELAEGLKVLTMKLQEAS